MEPGLAAGFAGDEMGMPPTKLDRATIEMAFDEIAALAAERGILIDLAVYGGSCLMLASNIRDASEDVDAVYLSNRDEAHSIVLEVTRRRRLPDGWLNQAAKQFAPPRGNPAPNLLHFGNYPRDGRSIGMRVFIPTPEYMLAMKVLSNRAPDDGKSLTDTTDAVALMRITGIDTYGKLADLMRECYPDIPGVVSPDVSVRMKAKLENLVRLYSERKDEDNEPTWHAARGRTLS